MITLNTHSLGAITIENGNDSFFENKQITINGTKYDVSLFICENVITERHSAIIEGMINNIILMYPKAKQALLEQGHDNDTIKYFIDFHLNELPEYYPSLLSDLFETNDKALISNANVIDKMQLRGFIIGKNEKNTYITLDFTLGRELSDELLVVEFDEKMNITRIAHES